MFGPKIAISVFEKMQAQDILKNLRLPEFDDFSQFLRNLPASTLVGIGAFAAVVAYWLANRPKAVKPPCDLQMQSEEVQGWDGARKSVIGDSTQLLTHYYDDARTMYEVFRRGFNISENGPCLGSRKPNQPYQWLSYKEWIISELACYTYSMVVVPLYDTLGPGAIRYIINTADISTVVCDKPEKAKVLLEHVEKKETLGLKCIILMDPFEKDLKERGLKCRVNIQSMQEVESQWSPTYEDVHISYLPLAHMFERMVQSVVYCHGGRIGFFQGDIRLLSDDMKALRPTIFPVVPRLLNRMHDKIFCQADTPMKRWLLEFAAKRKKAEVQSGIIRNDSLWDKLFFNKIQICVKGPNVFKGYLKDEKRTIEALDKDGWLHTGDVGKWLPNGTLKIIDRKKHIFKLAQGEYIAPEKIENIYIRSEPVAQIYVHGDSLQAFLVGIVVPDAEVMPGWAQKKGFQGSYAQLCKNAVKAIYIHSEMFSVQNGLLTPTLKAKRPELREFFKKQIEELYSSISI
ncbi:hypothetical protein lerEdw1_016281 [Lerista edwardsae]|nr:hypothetical protein lerEdw1_016281 [Lerista edwardsae]